MAKKTPEEIAALKAKYGDETAKKEAKKAAKKAKFGDQNADKNMPLIELMIPWTSSWREPDGTFHTREIDLKSPVWGSCREDAEYAYRFNIWLNSGEWPTFDVKVRVARCDSLQEESLRRLYGDDIVFLQERPK